MDLNKQQIEIAIGAGLELLGDKSEVIIPVKLNDGVFLLKQLLMGIAQGQVGLATTEALDEPPKPNRRARRTVKKIAKKAAIRKKPTKGT